MMNSNYINTNKSRVNEELKLLLINAEHAMQALWSIAILYF